MTNWYSGVGSVKIERRYCTDCVHPEKKYYQVIVASSREPLTGLISKEQAVEFCNENNLYII